MSDTATLRSGLETPTPWEQSSGRRAPSDGASRITNAQSAPSVPSTYVRRDSRDAAMQRERVERLTTGASTSIAESRQRQHSRNGSAAGSSGDYHEGQHPSSGRRHDYDVQAMESEVSARPSAAKNPIPAPIVTVRSEFPTMNRLRQQQTLTCLITVEVPEGNWRPAVDDLRVPPTADPSLVEEPQSARLGGFHQDARFDTRSIQYEPTENLDEVAENLRKRVDNWHGLEFSRLVSPPRGQFKSPSFHREADKRIVP